ncbi:MAG: hypothetical protein ABI480_16285 [Chitinophagaceae bacterium]
MKTVLSAFLLILSQLVYGQYYFNDIRDTRNLGDRMKDYTNNKVSSVIAVGFDADGARSSDFNEWQEINAAANVLKITTRNRQQITRQFYQFDKQFNLVRITDSSSDIKSVTVYNYDASNNIVSIKTTTTDSLSDFTETEERQWKYGSSGKPEKMWRILNGKDSTEYRFTLDEKGNIADEQLYRRGTGIDPVYYYYDESNKLTDIVRYNKLLKRLLPDVMFEYDENNKVTQKMTILSTTKVEYLIWRYAYNDKGLKVKEVLFDKKKEMTGKIEYGYTYLP